MVNIVIRAWYERRQLRARVTFDDGDGRGPHAVVTDSVDDVCRIIGELIESRRPDAAS